MRANRRTDTKPEVALRHELHRQGFRYRKDYRLDLAGARVRPDIAFTGRRVAVFVDGCFWHCCPQHGSQPANNTWYWKPKLERNVERDRAADTALTAAGWTVVRVWEHESLEGAVGAVVSALAVSPEPRRRSRRAVQQSARRDVVAPAAGPGAVPEQARRGAVADEAGRAVVAEVGGRRAEARQNC